MAAIDVSGVVSGVAEQAAPVAAVGIACLLVFVAVQAFNWVRAAVGQGGVGAVSADAANGDDHWAGYSVLNRGESEIDYWDGYTAADDARDRAAAGLAPHVGTSAVQASDAEFDADWDAYEREQSR